MEKNLKEILEGYQSFRAKYAADDKSIMRFLADYGQKPKIMFVACCDSRVDPALILQCDPGDLFVVRNVANIVPPYEKDDGHHGTSAALEFGIKFLGIKHLIILGHSQCGGVNALLNNMETDFISSWVSLIKTNSEISNVDEYAKHALKKSYQDCLSFPWIKEKIAQGSLRIHLWFFDIKQAEIYAYSKLDDVYHPLDLASFNNNFN